MKMTDIWTLYEADKRILGFSPYTLKAYSLQLKVLIREIGNLNIGASSLGHRIRFIRSLFRFAFEEGYILKNPTTKLREPRLEIILRYPVIPHVSANSWSFYIVLVVA
ncbi:hypothetical protein PMI05_05926 [Brevibacillus sp. BC25]|nr:hypothetical protein PMI05_05926 [Brevibacillus sp. BC25]